MTAAKLFVYGSLRRGLGNHHHLGAGSRCRFIATGHTVEPLYLTGLRSREYPFLSQERLSHDLSSAPKRVFGELYEITDESLLLYLDHFEDTAVYERRILQVTATDASCSSYSAYCYIVKPALVAGMRRVFSTIYEDVPGDDWKKHLEIP